jgi:hypothetical protein
MKTIEQELQAVKKMLNITGKFGLQAEVVHNTLNVIKNNPSLSLSGAIEEGLMFFKNLITINRQ